MDPKDSISPELLRSLLGPLRQAYGDPNRFSGLFRAGAFKVCRHAQAFVDTHRYELSECSRYVAEARRKAPDLRNLMSSCYRFSERVSYMRHLTSELVDEYGGKTGSNGQVTQLTQLIAELESLQIELNRVLGNGVDTHHHTQTGWQNGQAGEPPAFAMATPAESNGAGAWGRQPPPPMGGWLDGQRSAMGYGPVYAPSLYSGFNQGPLHGPGQYQAVDPRFGVAPWPQWPSYSGPTHGAEPVSSQRWDAVLEPAELDHAPKPARSGHSRQKVSGAPGARKRNGKGKAKQQGTP